MKQELNTTPPKWPLKVVRILIRPEYLEEIEGDMEEVYRDDLDVYSPMKARLLYVWNALMLLRPSLLKNSISMNLLNNIAMLRNYLKSGWRNFLKYKTYSTINILGLSIGFTASLLLFLIINYENSFDKFHPEPDDLYRVAIEYSNGDQSDLIVTPQAPVMEDEYTDIIASSRFFGSEDIMEHEGKFVRSTFTLVDSSFATMFRFPAIIGDTRKALATPDQIVLTKTLAEKIFGSADPIGEALSLVNEDLHFVVAAVVEDPPKNSTLQFEALIPWMNAPEWLDIDQAGNWYNTFMTGYVQLAPGTDKDDMESRLVAFKDRHILEERRASENIALLPLMHEHFRSSGNQRILTILGIIAASILLISCINFMNLSISQLLERTKEIGVRKVMGSRPWQLIMQFMSESFIICSLALFIGLFATCLFTPMVSKYFDFGIQIDSLASLSTVFFVLLICFGAALLSSLWPSFMLAGLKSSNLLSNTISWNKTGGYFRKGLIVLQYSASILLIIGTVVIWKQLHFMKDQDMKFDGDHVVSMEFSSELFKNPEVAETKMLRLKEQLLQEPSVISVSAANSVPGNYWQNYNTFSSADSTLVSEASLRQTTVDDKFFETFGMPLLMGRGFSKDLEGDQTAVILNESAMKKYGWTDLGDKFLKPGGGGEIHQVIGVVRDYYYQSLRENIQPMIHFYHPEAGGQLAVKLHPERVSEGLAMLETKWNELDPYESFSYSFVDESFDELYKEQERMGFTSTVFCIIALILAGLGLFSLSAYSIRLRKKEVGVRKVLGASLSSIVVILSKNFGLLILLAFLITCPIIYLLLNKFLLDFAHHINLTPDIFIIGGLLIFVFSMLIVGVQSTRAALENPIHSIKDE